MADLDLTYYVSVVKAHFKAKFMEMAGISLSVAGLSFLVGYGVKSMSAVTSSLRLEPQNFTQGVKED